MEDAIVGPGADCYLLSWIATAITASRAAKDQGGIGKSMTPASPV
jgi:hypothetical protein